MRNINWDLLRAKLKEAIFVLPHFFKNPVQGMRNLPDWDWPTMLVLEAAFAAICGVISNLLERNILGMITGLIIAPLAHLIVMAIATGFFYYTFMFFFKREIPYRQIFLTLMFAAIPLQILNVAVHLIPPLVLVGLAASMFLLFVAFVDNFHLDRAKVSKMLVGILAIYAIFWAIQLVRVTSKHERLRMKATPESLDILEKELNFDD